MRTIAAVLIAALPLSAWAAPDTSRPLPLQSMREVVIHPGETVLVTVRVRPAQTGVWVVTPELGLKKNYGLEVTPMLVSPTRSGQIQYVDLEVENVGRVVNGRRVKSQVRIKIGTILARTVLLETHTYSCPELVN